AAFFSDKTITVKNDAIASLNQSRTVRDNANQCKQLENMLAMMKNRNNSRAQTQSMGLTLGDRTASRA
ncbi:MAG: hypothetical protein IJC30_03000, partial [Alphaproteobacteria bacterium]|nr:hypothetical protein [Alphaproteobacteria bacterium]